MTAPFPTGVRRQARSKQAGFTLIELAVVIVVIALLLGSILVPLTSQVEQRKVLETQKTLDEIKEALIGFAMINGRLPRPATSSLGWYGTRQLHYRTGVHWLYPLDGSGSIQGRLVRQDHPLQRNAGVRQWCVYASHCRNQNGKDKGRRLGPAPSRRRCRQLSSHKAQITGAQARMAAR